MKFYDIGAKKNELAMFRRDPQTSMKKGLGQFQQKLRNLSNKTHFQEEFIEILWIYDNFLNFMIFYAKKDFLWFFMKLWPLGPLKYPDTFRLHLRFLILLYNASWRWVHRDSCKRAAPWWFGFSLSGALRKPVTESATPVTYLPYFYVTEQKLDVM